MVMCDAPIATTPIAAAFTSLPSGATGSLAPFDGIGTQGEMEFRGELFWANETRSSFRARESDGDEMLGVTDKDPAETVWYECDFIDILHGASITRLYCSGVGSILVLSQLLVSNGQVNHKARALLIGGSLHGTDILVFQVNCSDGSVRKRSLKIRSRTL